MKISINQFNSISKEEITDDDINKLDKYEYIRYRKMIIISLFLSKMKNISYVEKIYLYRYKKSYYIKFTIDNQICFYMFNSLDEFNIWIHKRFNNICNKCNNK